MTRLSHTAAATVLVAAAAFLLHVPAGAADPAPDTTAPTGAVGGVRNPASGTLGLQLYASDAGVGLANAEATLDGQSAFDRLGSGACPEHPTSEPPPSVECPESVSAVPLSLDTRAIADGSHRLVVRVTDAAANTATLLDQMIVVKNTPPVTGSSASVTVGIASLGAGASSSAGGSLPPSPPSKGSGRCRGPKLEMHLAHRPLWRTRPGRLPVLRFAHRYPYRGRLTCLVSGRRVSAPDGTAVHLTYRIWRRTFGHRKRPLRVRKGAIRVRKGHLGVRLAFSTGRTLVFSYRDPGGATARAKLRIAIARTDPPRKGER